MSSGDSEAKVDEPHQDIAAQEIVAIEARSKALHKELGVRDLVLTQLLYVVGAGWVGTAAKLGSSQIVFWLLAALLFYLPQAAVVTYLSRRLPLEGGLYQWAKIGFNERVGFFVAWNLWIYTIVLISAFGLSVATTFSYLLGDTGALIAGNRWYNMVVTAGLIGTMVVTATYGLRLGKWVHNLGGITQILAFTGLIAVPFIAAARGKIPAYHPLIFTLPALSLFTLNIFGKMSMGAFSGFEWVAILAGETRDPVRSISRSVIIATPIIVFMFIFGTATVVALIPIDRIDLISPVAQALQVGLEGVRGAGLVVPFLVLMILMRLVANTSVLFTGNTRLPMVAGWDGLLPAWFTRLHARHLTPVNSIRFVGAVTMILALVSLVGVGHQEAYQLLENAAGILYGLTYLVMFAIPLFGLRNLPGRVPMLLRISAASGLAVTALYTVLSIFPIIDVSSWLLFSAKIVGVIVGANIIGYGVMLGGRTRANV